MTESTCLICSNPSELLTCDPCRNRIRGLLHALPLQWLALQDSRHRLVTGGGDGRSSARLHAPLPGDERVLNLLGPASPDAVSDGQDQAGETPFLTVLWGWTEVVTEKRGLTPVSREFAPMVTRLMANLTWIANQPFVKELAEEIEDLVRTCRRITMTEPVRLLLRGVRCPSCEMLSLVRYTPSSWAAECMHCPAVKLDQRDYSSLVRGQAHGAHEAVKSSATDGP